MNVFLPPVTFLLRCCAVLCVAILSGCATLSPSFENPQVQVLSIKQQSSKGMDQTLVVLLNVQNPNGIELPLEGMSYSLSIEGNKVASGVTSDVPTIPAYGEANVALPVTTNLMAMVRLVSGLMMKGQQDLDYELQAKLDVGIPLVPKLSVSEAGTIPLGSLR